jgi:cytochrome c551/c552
MYNNRKFVSNKLHPITNYIITNEKFKTKTMKKIVKLMSKAAVLGLMLSLTGCYYDDLQVAEEIVIEDEVSFATDIQGIFNDNDCMRCHNADRDPDLRVGQAYNSLVPEYVVANDPESSLLVTQLEDGHRSVSATEIALIKAWIDQGAQE